MLAGYVATPYVYGSQYTYLLEVHRYDFYQYYDNWYPKDYETDKIQLIRYNIVCPKVIIPPQKLKVGSIWQVIVHFIVYKLISTYCHFYRSRLILV